MNFHSIIAEVQDNLGIIKFNRAEKANAMDSYFWQELPQALQNFSENPQVRVVLIYGEGKNFSAGIDLAMLASLKEMVKDLDIGRASEKIQQFIQNLQESINAIEKCSKPVIACIHGACIGGAVDLIAACDMRFASQEAYFCIKEVDMGIIADLGTLQRLPKLIPAGMVAELAYTARNFSAQEALQMGLVNKIWESKDQLLSEAQKIASQIAEKSPLVVRGIKKTLLYSRERSVQEGLQFISHWNAS
ncbi:MAG: crotonase/enoyl-CoA hydratase family protein, partial [Raineya sp.]|nr:crotonase/enoyl-CoA hydratase family protein [Raineya sp.]